MSDNDDFKEVPRQLRGIDLAHKHVASQTIKEAEEAFDKLRKDYHLLREHTDRLEAILREHNIPFPEFWGW